MIVQIIINSLVLSSIYILFALGLTLIFGVMKIPNFAHGVLYALGAFMTYTLINNAGFGYVLALVGAVGVLFIMGILVERFFFRPVRDKETAPLIVALGLAFAISNIILRVWGGWPLHIPTPFTSTIIIGGASVTLHRLLIIVIGIGASLLVYLFLIRTKMGCAIRGVSQDRKASALMGISINRICLYTFGIGTALAAMAGGLVGPVFSIYPAMGDLLVVKAFAIIILGGMGSAIGAIFGGFVLGFAESFTSAYLISGYEGVIAFSIIIIVLMVKPKGLFGGA